VEYTHRCTPGWRNADNEEVDELEMIFPNLVAGMEKQDNLMAFRINS
jgi:hypothetical protein